MKLILFLSLMLTSSFMTKNVLAEELNNSSNEKLVAVTERYYKTVTNNTMSMILNNNSNSYTVEISKEEFENYNVSDSPKSTTIETTYKKMTTSIYSSNSYYRYQVDLKWKNIPSTRSYDTIAIGFPASVRSEGTPDFTEKYCQTSSNCKTTTGYLYSYNSTNGVGVTFSVPTGTLVSLSQSLSINIRKNTDATIIKQYAYGDYSHATSKVSLSNAKKYIVNTLGIVLDGSVIKNYDDISPARAEWNGVW